ncbi:MAG: hypothetical protein KME42_17735 [Tildeniella nuda ZEHNDER 1965/U140]|jgi:hypothetical protein|nr:hypothetical protein [Tildeniella nuda ZEHNDER 1965/U140]
MQTVNCPQKIVFFNSLSHGNVAIPSTPKLPSPEASTSYPNVSSQVTESSRSNRIPQMLFGTIAIVVGMTAISVVTYVTSNFVIAQLESRQPLNQRQRLEPKQQKFGQSEPTVLNADVKPGVQDPLADAPAKMHLDRAGRFAAIGKFKDAIASANNIQLDSPSYGTARQSINQWSDQLLQSAQRLYAVNKLAVALDYARAVPATSDAFPNAQQLLQQWEEQQQIDESNNQEHLQMAQQALEQEDGITAAQEAGQMTNDPRWQAQKTAMMQRAELWSRVQKAKQLIEQGEPENAIHEARRLPIAPPWLEKRNRLIEEANQLIADEEADRRRREICQDVTVGLLSECPNPADILDSLSNFPSGLRSSKLRRH